MKAATIMIRVTTDQKLAIKRMTRKQGLTIIEFMLLNMIKSISKFELQKELDLDLGFKKTNE